MTSVAEPTDAGAIPFDDEQDIAIIRRKASKLQLRMKSVSPKAPPEICFPISWMLFGIKFIIGFKEN
jgi:hypothetical protein